MFAWTRGWYHGVKLRREVPPGHLWRSQPRQPATSSATVSGVLSTPYLRLIALLEAAAGARGLSFSDPETELFRGSSEILPQAMRGEVGLSESQVYAAVAACGLGSEILMAALHPGTSPEPLKREISVAEVRQAVQEALAETEPEAERWLDDLHPKTGLPVRPDPYLEAMAQARARLLRTLAREKGLSWPEVSRHMGEYPAFAEQFIRGLIPFRAELLHRMLDALAVSPKQYHDRLAKQQPPDLHLPHGFVWRAPSWPEILAVVQPPVSPPA